jgi:hypothetical protein
MLQIYMLPLYIFLKINAKFIQNKLDSAFNSRVCGRSYWVSLTDIFANRFSPELPLMV